MSQEMKAHTLRQRLSRVHFICLIIWKTVRQTGKKVTNIFRSNTYEGSRCNFQISQFNEVTKQVVECFILTDGRAKRF